MLEASVISPRSEAGGEFRIRAKRSERGAFAIIAAAVLVAVTGLAVVMVQIGLQALDQYEVRDAAEALALADGFQVLSTPGPGFGLVEASTYVSGNAKANDQADTRKILPVSTLDGYPVNNPYGAGGAESQVHASTVKLLSGGGGPSGGLTIAGGGGLQSVGGYGRAVVNQYQFSNWLPVPTRIVLVLDYSTSMRLGYAGSAVQFRRIMLDAVQLILTDNGLNGRVDWGIVPFADNVQGDIKPVSLGPASLATQLQKLADQTNLINNAAQSTNSFGTGTNLGEAIKAATAMLAPTGGSNDIFLGKGMMIIITDGEPDASNNISPAADYGTKIRAADLEAQAAASLAWGQNIATIPVLMHQAQAYAAGDDAFMRSIAGDETGQHDFYYVDAGAANAVQNLLTQLPDMISTHCISKDTLTIQANDWLAPPQPQDLMYGFWLKPSNGQENTAQFVDITNKEMLKGQGVSQFYYHFGNINRVEINQDLCLPVILNNQPLAFRLRWGIPRLLSSLGVNY